MKQKRKKTKMIKGVIFDLDGTLIDSMRIWYDVDRNFLIENGVKDPPREISERLKKMTVFESSALLIKEFGLKLTQEYVIKRIEELVKKEYEENIPLKVHAVEIMDFLDKAGIPYGVATATYKSLAEAVMKRLGIYDRVSFLLTDVEFPKGKKFPDIFLGAAEILGTAPNETLVVEDSLHCLETAVNAGFMTAAVYDESALPDKEAIEKTAHYYFDSLKEIEKLFT